MAKFKNPIIARKLRERKRRIHDVAIRDHKELPFGKNVGKTLEWLFFNDLHYLRWIKGENCLKNLSNCPAERFEELLLKSEHLAPLCSECRSNPAHIMIPDEVMFSFRCESCNRINVVTGFSNQSIPPSFLIVDDPFGSACDQALLAGITTAFFGRPRMDLTEKEARDFFEDPSNFNLPRI